MISVFSKISNNCLYYKKEPCVFSCQEGWRPQDGGALPRQVRVCAGGTSSSCKQRKTERSRWGTPCQPYRVWILAGCVRLGAPCFCFIRICLRTILLANHPLQHAASGSRPPHGSEPDAENVRLIPAFCAKMPCRHAGMQCRFLASFPRLFA